MARVCFWRDSPPVGHGLLIHEVFGSHTTSHHSRDSSGRVISSSQRPLPDNTQHSQQTDIQAPLVGFEPTVSAGERPQNYALDRAATGNGSKWRYGDKIKGEMGWVWYGTVCSTQGKTKNG